MISWGFRVEIVPFTNQNKFGLCSDTANMEKEKAAACFSAF